MDVKNVLAELGLSEGEIKVYLSLLKLGSVPVSRVKEDSELHRTTIYDFIEKLLNKGLVNYVVRNNVKYYNAAHPNKLLEFLKEKQDHVNQVLPELIEISKFEKEEIAVEVYKGPEGIKTLLLDAVRSGVKEVVGIGVDESRYKKNVPIFIEQYQRLLKENNIHERMIVKSDPEYLFNQEHTHYKFVPASQFSPVSTVVYADKVQIGLWEPAVTSILIKNKQLADAYRKHFEILWKQESLIFKGEKEIKQLFEIFLNQKTEDKEWTVFGAPPLDKKWSEYFISLDPFLIKEHIKTKIIFDEQEKTLINFYTNSETTTIKTLPKEYVTPSEVNVFGDKVAIVMYEDEPMGILIHNKKIAGSFRQYFKLLWKIAKNC